jgi:hypothetical protein
LGNDISNSVAPEPTQQHLARYEALLKKHALGWRPRKPPCGGYNCFGHIWTSRRTSIYDVDAVRRIFAEDGYRITPTPEVDDLAIVVQQQDIHHVGRVVEVRSIVPGGLSVAWIVSKWDDWGGEVVHPTTDLPFDPAHGFHVEVEYWTDRPRSN